MNNILLTVFSFNPSGTVIRIRLALELCECVSTR